MIKRRVYTVEDLERERKKLEEHYGFTTDEIRRFNDIFKVEIYRWLSIDREINELRSK